MRTWKLILMAGLAAGVMLTMARLNGDAGVPAGGHEGSLPAPVRHAQVPVLASVVAKSSEPQRPQVWDEKYGKSTDALSFIREAAKAGIGGDGRAAYYVSNALRHCSAMNRVEGESADAWLQREQVEAAAMEGTAAEKAQFQVRAVNLYRYCGTLIGHDAFDGLDAQGGNPGLPSFWLNLARNARDTLAWAEKFTQQLRTLAYQRSTDR